MPQPPHRPAPAALLAALVLLSGCGLLGAPPAPPARPGTTYVLVDAPAGGQSVGSPLVLSGRVAPRPPGDAVTYRLLGPDGSLLASGTIALQGPIERPGVFTESIGYELAQAGPGRVEVRAIDPGSGATLGSGSAAVSLSASGAAPPGPSAPALQPTPQPPPTAGPPPPTATETPPLAAAPAPGGIQQIFIDTPPPDTIVGSPVTLTGRASSAPSAGTLSYRVIDLRGRELAAGSFSPTTPGPAEPATWGASIAFALPPDGGPVIVEISDRDGSTSAVLASASIRLQVADPR